MSKAATRVLAPVANWLGRVLDLLDRTLLAIETFGYSEVLRRGDRRR